MPRVEKYSGIGDGDRYRDASYECGSGLGDAAVVAIGFESRVGHGGFEADQTVGIADGVQPLEEGAVDDRESHRAQTDSQRQSQDRDQRESRALAHAAQSVTGVLKQRLDGGDATLVACLFFR
jgi:hypothetical protein